MKLIWKLEKYHNQHMVKTYLKEVGSPITVTRFVRYERGEGIEVEKVDFAEEVARQMGK